jgi:F0F1-type ATP synthase membrane subunit c/vacuolar-type H+-ATPase subunit K
MVGMRRAQREGDANALQLLRQLFISFVVALLLIGAVVAGTAGDTSSDADGLSSSVVAAGVAAYGIVSLFAPRLFERPLDCATDTALISGYRTRFFLRIAFAEAAALIGFVGAFLSGNPWMYALGAAFAAVGFVRLAPSRRNLHTDEEALNLQGCGRSLTRLLLSARPGTTES